MTGIADLELTKAGWLEKYSVGRGIIPLKNWQKRWFVVDHQGLNYSKSPAEAPAKRTYIPFIAGPGNAGDVLLAPVFLYASVSSTVHQEANNENAFFFALRFHERGTPRLLLLRTNDTRERESWIRFLSLFVHAATLSGATQSNVVAPRRGLDPDELDPREKIVLKQAVLAWDEGCQLRANGGALPVVAPDNFEDCAVWNSDDELSGQQSRRGSKSNGQTPPMQSPRKPGSPSAKQNDYDCL